MKWKTPIGEEVLIGLVGASLVVLLALLINPAWRKYAIPYDLINPFLPP